MDERVTFSRLGFKFQVDWLAEDSMSPSTFRYIGALCDSPGGHWGMTIFQVID